MTTAAEPSDEESSLQPRVKARGHLSLVEWEERKGIEWKALQNLTDPVRRSPLDRVYSSGILFLLITTCLAVAASLAHR